MNGTLSFWEREEMLTADCIIIGGGIIGLSTAITYKEQYPHHEVIVLEREILPSGASSKNAGFWCYGYATELLHEIAEHGESATLALVEARIKGFELLRSRLTPEQIGLDVCGGHELLWQSNSHAVDSIDYLNTLLRPLFPESTHPEPYFIRADERISDFGFNKDVWQNCIVCPYEGGINSGRMMKNLALLAGERGVRIVTGAEVISVDSIHDTLTEIEVRRHVIGDTVTFRTRVCIICTNAFTKRFLPDEHIKPGRGQVLVTHPIEPLPFRGTFHFDDGYYYFRHIGNRILLGGGRNSDFIGETTDKLHITSDIQTRLEVYLQTAILPSVPDVQVDIRWAGIMGFEERKKPIIKSITPSLYLAFGCNGMGVSLGSSVAKEVVELLDKRD
jgi:gamma-glutamylputrescine oxidase